MAGRQIHQQLNPRPNLSGHGYLVTAMFLRPGGEERMRKPAIQLNEEPAVVVRETSPALRLTPQDHQLMSERGILSLKVDLRLERRGQHGQNKPDQRDHRARILNFALRRRFIAMS
jgi:hypothetical protein